MRMVLHARNDVKIAGFPAISPGMAFARDADFRAVIRARRNFDGNALDLLLRAVAVALAAGMQIQFPRAAALRTGLRQAERPLDLPRAVARRAGFKVMPRLAASAVALAADDIMLH